MFRLTREVRFALTSADDPQLRHAPANSFAGYPSLTGVQPHLALQVTLEGNLQGHSSYLRNIKEIDEVVRQRAIGHMQGLIGAKQAIPARLMDLLHDGWPGAQLVKAAANVESVFIGRKFCQGAPHGSAQSEF